MLTCPSSPYGQELGYQESFHTGFTGKVAQSSYAACIGDYKNATGTGWHLDEWPYFFFGNGHVPPRGVISRFGWSARFKDIPDGLSNTFALGEVVGQWSINQDFPYQSFATTSHPINIGNPDFLAIGNVDWWELRDTNPNQLIWDWALSFRSMHPGGAHFLMCDASVPFVTESIDHFTYMARASREGGEIEGSASP